MAAPKSIPDPFVCATHDVLFTPDATPRCDVCGDAVPDVDDPESTAGRALFVTTRGDEVRYESPPLCARCASAIGASVLARADVEEEDE